MVMVFSTDESDLTEFHVPLNRHLQNIYSNSEEGEETRWTVHGYHSERRGSFTELHRHYNACKLGVCCTLKRREYRQFQDGREVIGVSEAQLRFCNQYCIGNGTYQCGSRGNSV